MVARQSVECIAEGKHIRLMRRDGWEYAQRRGISGIVGIAALTEDHRILLVEQYRPPLQTYVIELPAGLAGDGHGRSGEPLEAAARRELFEETGYLADNWSVLMAGVTSPGITDERVSIFLAQALHREGPVHGDGTENIILHEIPLPVLRARLKAFAEQGKAINFMVYASLAMIGDRTGPKSDERHFGSDGRMN